MPLRRTPETRAADSEIRRLALPAFLALVAEPLFLLGDAAVVGHLGTAELAGLGIASVVVRVVVGLCVFLAYGTTAAVARQVGAGRRADALARGIDGLWLALLIGVVVTLAGLPLTGPLVGLFDVGPDVTAAATTYLRLAWLGTTATATHQLASTVWTFLAYTLDAVAIAAQAITGTALGAGDLARTRRAADRMVRIGVVSGVVTGLLLAATAPLLGPLFTDDGDVVALLGRVLLVAALFQPLAGVVFVLDGVLIGAGDGRYLAAGGLLVTACFVPVALLTARLGPGGVGGLLGLWTAFGLVFIGGRAAVLLRRARGDAWMVAGTEPLRAGPH